MNSYTQGELKLGGVASNRYLVKAPSVLALYFGKIHANFPNRHQVFDVSLS
jgi:hypothetical protein